MEFGRSPRWFDYRTQAQLQIEDRSFSNWVSYQVQQIYQSPQQPCHRMNYRIAVVRFLHLLSLTESLLASHLRIVPASDQLLYLDERTLGLQNGSKDHVY